MSEDRIPVIHQPGNSASLRTALEASHAVLDTAEILRDMRTLKTKIAERAALIRVRCGDDAIDALLQLHDQIGDAIPAVEADLPATFGPAEYRFPNNQKAL